MVNRILEIIKQENITASKFADKIGVQRSSISHILSERNKPSLELIQRILIAYPKVNAEWLITGKSPKIILEDKTILENELKKTLKEEELINKKVKEMDLFTNVNDINLDQSTKTSLEEDTNVNNVNVKELMNNNTKKEDVSQLVSPKIVERIVLFYTDKTFKEYFPE